MNTLQRWWSVLHRGIVPGRAWTWARRMTQAMALAALVLGPLWGGWLRLEQSELAAWQASGSALPPVVSERLPNARTPAFIDRTFPFLGGGIAAEYVSMPLMDPVAGALALMHTHASWRAWTALSCPVLIALVAGRIFCGWLCPFGILARGVDRLLDLVPWRPRYRVPRRRPLRWMVLGSAIAASLMGVHLLLYLSLPYLLLQQSVYAMWLLGGGGAVLAVLLGLLAAGLIMGPTSYCAALCPTGAALSLLGRARPVQLAIAEPSACGRGCRLCDAACWLHLQPASGDPGPDCDLCGRCVTVCPRANLQVRMGRTARTAWPLLPLLVAVFGIAAGFASPVAADAPMRKPRLILEREQTLAAVTLACPSWISAAWHSTQMPRRRQTVSTSRRTIYRQRLFRPLAPGDAVTLDPVPGWLEQPDTWIVPSKGNAVSSLAGLPYFGAALLIFVGAISFALTLAPKAHAHLDAKRA